MFKDLLKTDEFKLVAKNKLYSERGAAMRKKYYEDAKRMQLLRDVQM